LTSNVYYNGIFRYANSSQTAGAYAVVGNSHAWYIAPSGTAGNAISFTQAMTLDASGNLGVGTTSPVGALQVLRASANPTVNVTRTTSSATTLGEALYLRLNDSNGQSGMRTEIGMGYGIPGTQTYTPAVIGYVQTIGTANTYGDLYFATRGVTTDTAPTERARITSDGNLLVGTTASTIATITQNSLVARVSNGSLLVHHENGNTGSDFAGFGYDSSTIGTISQNSTTTVGYNTSSDYRLKNTIAPMTGALAKVALLKPVTYKWNADGSDGQGFIAHELAEIVPECVNGEKDAVDEDGNPKYQGIDTSFLVATLTAAIQELKAELDSVKAELATLKGK
jgi:hypothetical protein